MLDPVMGEISIFQKEKFFKEQKVDKADFIKLNLMSCCTTTVNETMSKKGFHPIEIQFISDKFVLVIGAYC